MKKLTILSLIFLCGLFALTSSSDCVGGQAVSDSGVAKASVKVETDVNGNTVEQKDIMKRYQRDNKVGSIKHLYIISAYTGDVLEYSTVMGKVTSGGKRLSPKTVENISTLSSTYNTVTLNGNEYITNEMIDENGTYGESANYIYWFDAQDNYHQYFPSGGTYLHISDKPLRIRKANFTIITE